MSELKKHKYTCIFGAGVLLNNAWKQVFTAIGGRPDFICDNSSGKWGKAFYGVKCISPEELYCSVGNVAVFIGVKHYVDITEQLRSAGINDIYNIIYSKNYDTVLKVTRADDIENKKEIDIMPLEGKLALVTGSSRGIGRLIAHELMKLGVNIIAHSRSIEHLKPLEAYAEKYNVKLEFLAAELSDSEELEKMLESIEPFAADIDILYNNAGVSIPSKCDSAWNTPVDDFVKTSMVNFIAPVKIGNAIIPYMLEKGFGRIINVSSSIEYRLPDMAYSCSKAALNKYVHDIAPSLEGSGVMISLLDPGWLKTDMGGSHAVHEVDSVIPGAMLGAVIDANINGEWITAQDYSGMPLEDAVSRAAYLLDIN